ncbi:glutathione S-transferase T1 isoform X1 [Hevea brasiliensis]|uniref:glutathione S-transferase T1 isoform X1 n=1 Tax=Hevea brasiliensis TaxID=3981 RepID=UPI0025EDFBA6|nr:glutathione S-transferase T1 isoform X1 [Hevea brasiliensis]
MELKVYGHRASQPSRAIMIFCKANNIEFEEVTIDLSKGQHKSPEYKEINPMGQVPAIIHGELQLFESHAILTYLASAFPGVADHCSKQFPIHAKGIQLILSREPRFILCWTGITQIYAVAQVLHTPYIFNARLAPVFGLPLNPQAAAEAEKILISSLSTIESFWLQDSGTFLLGGNQPSIADLSLVCEIMQLELLDENERNRFLGPYKKVQQWIENTKNAINPQFDEMHGALYQLSAKMGKQ